MPPHPSEKPWWKHLNIDLLNSAIHSTVLHPILVCFLPLAFLAQSHPLSSPTVVNSTYYAIAVSIYNLLWHLLTLPPSSRTFNPDDEVILITGGASGVGLLIAEVYGMRGISVAVLDVHLVTDEIPGVLFLQCDISSPTAVAAARRTIEEELGPVTVVINNAATVTDTPVLSATPDQVASAAGANLVGHYNVLREFVPAMVTAGTGSVVTIGSVLGLLPAAGTGLYAPMKAGLMALHEVLTAELKGAKGVVTLLVVPGQIRTDLFRGVKTPSWFWAGELEAVDVAKELVRAIDAGKAGELRLPLYVRWAGVWPVLPLGVRRVLRWWSGIDTAMRGYTGGKRE